MMNYFTTIGKRMHKMPGYSKAAKTVEIIIRLQDKERVIRVHGNKLYVNPKDSDVDYLLWRDRDFEPHITKFVLANLKKDYFVDVGANTGYYSVLVGDICPVVAIEPNPATLMKLQRNLTLNNLNEKVHVHPIAAWSEDTTVHFQINFKNPGLSSIQPDGPLSVTAKRIDGLIKRHVGILKIDVEGAEYEVLKGCSRLLDKDMIRYVVVEMRKEKTDYPITRMLSHYGYNRYDFNNREVFESVFYKDKLVLR